MKYILTEEEYKALKAGNTDHESKAMLRQYEALSTSHQILISDYKELRAEYNALMRKYEVLKEEDEDLQLLREK